VIMVHASYNNTARLASYLISFETIFN